MRQDILEIAKELELKQIFKNRSNCYADSDEVIMAMDEDRFIEVLKELKILPIPSVSNSVDFWKDAQEFLKSQLPDDFQEKLNSYVTEKGYNSNECMLFKSMLIEAVGLYGTVMVIKHYH